MTRYKLTIEYDGTGLLGWQRQSQGASVQAHLEMALHRFCGTEVEAFCAGRTDAGVHAIGQVAHVDLPRAAEPFRLMQAVNFYLLPERISVVRAEQVTERFHARFSAVRRQYRYRILARRAKPALDIGYAWHIPVPLDAESMHAAAQLLIGHHDFSTFRSSECQANSALRTLDSLEVLRHGELVEVTASSRSFLHHQVRNMVGSLALVGTGKWTGDDLAAAFAAQDRRAGGPTAPACGLYFTQVEYPPEAS
jgi:tRNA pseudouridine38-40 synthase